MSRLLAGIALLMLPAAAAADSLPRVADADWPAVRARCRALADFLAKADATLPADTLKPLAALLADDDADAETALARLQDLLDPLCLVGVHVNPESRVKAARGPLDADLTRDRPRLVLVKVHNEGGITAPLAIGGEELISAGDPGAGRWLEAAVVGPAPRTLGGVRLEYVAVRLTAREDGRREAVLKFDAGQGTQDLGFRAEVPVLFRVRSR